MADKNQSPPKLAHWLIYQSLKKEDQNYIIGDFEETFYEIAEDGGLAKAKLWYWKHALKSIPYFIYNLIYWKIVMIRGYIKIAWRNILKNRSYASVNVFGLAIGITYSIFILLFVLFELGYDSYHEDVNRSFLVGLAKESEINQEYYNSNLPLMIPALKEKYKQIEYAGRINGGGIVTVNYQDARFKEEDLWHADPEVFQILSIPFTHGSPETALKRPNTVVLTEEMVIKYFGYQDPIGETISVGERDYEVTGVIKNSPHNTVFNYSIIMSWKTVENDEYNVGWRPGIVASTSLIKLSEGVNPFEFERLISELPHEYMDEALEERGLTYRNYLFPLKDKHLYKMSDGGMQASTYLVYIYIFSATAILVLLIACMNFMNLSTARFINRSQEIGIRKVVGANRGQLIGQFLGESVFIAFVAMLLAILMVFLFLPIFNEIIQTNFIGRDLLQSNVLIGIISIALLTGLISGSYPALFLSAFKPVSILKGTLRTGRNGASMRRILVVAQFAISISIVIATLIVYKQITFMKNQPLGFSSDQKLVFEVAAWGLLTENYETIKTEFMSHPAVSNASVSSGVPGSFVNRTWVYPENEEKEKGQAFRSLRCDQNFIEIYEIELLAGRSFDANLPGDIHEKVIINEAGAKAFGWSSPEEAIGKFLSGHHEVIGVSNNFHWWGLQQPIEPMLMRVVPSLFRSITLMVDKDNMPETIANIEVKYAKLFPEGIFDYYFVDENFRKQYQYEEKIFNIFMIFTVLGIFIACLGLIGLASFIAEQRTREIGIRKIYGASIQNIYVLLSKEFLKWVIAGSIIAIPIIYKTGNTWLESFAYRFNFDWTVFALALFIISSISIITISYQVLKASNKKSIDALNY